MARATGKRKYIVQYGCARSPGATRGDVLDDYGYELLWISRGYDVSNYVNAG